MSLRKPYNIVLAIVLWIIAFLPLPASPALAETLPEQPQEFKELAKDLDPVAEVISLSLQDCIAAAIKNNLNIQVDGYSPRINAAIVQSQKGVFDPHIYFNATYFHGVIPFSTEATIATGGYLTSVKVQQWIIAGGLAGAIPTGLIYDLGMVSEHTTFSTINDAFDRNGEQRLQASLTLTQPLLKNFGIATNTTGIRVAAKNRESSIYQLEQRLLKTVYEVEAAYWELVFAYENLGVKKRSLQLAQNLLDENRVRLKVGVLAPLAVLQSEAGVAIREEEHIVAQSGVEDAKDRLIRVINLLPDRPIWNVEIVPEDEPLVFPPSEYSENDEIISALGNRPELKQLFKQREAAELGSRFARNQLLPSLDLIGSVGLIGLDDDYNSSSMKAIGEGSDPPSSDTGLDDASDDLFSGENFQWMIGFKFEFPWGSRSERGQYRTAKLQARQLDTGIQSLRHIIILDIRNALRGVETNWQRVVSTRKTTRFRQESLAAEKKKYDVGVSTTHNLLKFEEELAKAIASEERAKIDYTLSLSNLMRANATLLQARNVQVEIGS